MRHSEYERRTSAFSACDVHILIVEDDARFSEVLGDFLRDLGHEPQLVPSAEAALTVLQRQRPDLMLLDVQLPGMTGLDFLQLSAVRQSRVPIAVISGAVTEAEAQRCLRLGALEFMPKPLSLERLRDVLESLTPFALADAAAMAGRLREQRAAARVRVDLPVQVHEYGRETWDARAIELSVTGIKIGPTRSTLPGLVVNLAFAAPPELVPLTVLSVLARVDPDGYAFAFSNLTADQVDALNRLVTRLGGLSSD